MKIYTKTGDCGETSLYDGSRVKKDNEIITCIGTIDEFNSCVGCVIAHLQKLPNEELKTMVGYIELLTNIQNQLFDMGTLIAYPSESEKKKSITFDKNNDYVRQLEEAIDNMTSQLPRLVNFILPGGSIEMSEVHRARTICRRTETRLVSLKSFDLNIPDTCFNYMNRMSDFLFTLARYVGHVQNIKEIIYKKSKE